ncbi:hypothetical protein EF908_36445 [Streptomyces sp. WAC04770]|nr:RNase adapter RapZ [Streptomyces sp. WAC04770]RST14714.1 hypothetical protein EF908_36445 [Streptomyces sp. WAC04770]
MLHSHGLAPEVRTYVMATPGVQRLIRRAVERVLLLLEPEGETGRRADVHVVCGGGRHRSVATAAELGAALRAVGVGCEIQHRHITRPILATA